MRVLLHDNRYALRDFLHFYLLEVLHRVVWLQQNPQPTRKCVAVLLQQIALVLLLLFRLFTDFKGEFAKIFEGELGGKELMFELEVHFDECF